MGTIQEEMNAIRTMTRLIIPALVALLVSGPVIAAEWKEKPSGIPVLWVGDGKSFATAIFFISARSQSEALLLAYVHLKKNGQKSLEQSLIYKDGKRFDIHQTERGKMYFRLPSKNELK